MRFKTFRRKQGKMSRKRGRGGQEKQTDADMIAMEEGTLRRQSPMLGRQNSWDYDLAERGFAPTAPPMPEEAPRETAPMLGRQNSWDHDLAERGFAATAPPMPEENPQHAIDVSPEADVGMGNNGMDNNDTGGRRKRKTRKGRKGKKTRKGKKGGKKGKSHRR